MSGFFSTTFSQPLGSRVVPGELRGYYIDFRVKARSPAWPPPELQPLARQLHVDVAQWGLGAWEHYLASGREEWLAAAVAVGRHLVERQERDGALAGGWVHEWPYPHTFPLDPPWMSAMAQGEGASLLVRLAAETGEEALLESAVRARLPLLQPTGSGGLQSTLAGGPLLEEYPTQPASHVLNGAVFALWGCLDLDLAAGEPEMRALFEAGVDTLAQNISRWDTGWWSRYDLFPHPVPNIASAAYHDLHVTQLVAVDATAARPQLSAAAERWRAYGQRRASRLRAQASKVAFRLAVPRGRRLARALPWSRLR
jgi:heparosan-N-sulfate-glucuronate 5-epimerase